MTGTEAKQFALKLSCEGLLVTGERPENFLHCREFIDKIIYVLRGEDFERREEEATSSNSLPRPIDDISDPNGTLAL